MVVYDDVNVVVNVTPVNFLFLLLLYKIFLSRFRLFGNLLVKALCVFFLLILMGLIHILRFFLRLVRLFLHNVDINLLRINVFFYNVL